MKNRAAANYILKVIIIALALAAFTPAASPFKTNTLNAACAEESDGEFIVLEKYLGEKEGEFLAEADAKVVKIAEFSTDYSWSGEARKHNIALAASRLSGVVIEPDEVLSFNATVGPRTAANGFLAAPIIQNGKFVEGAGGGVCQVSSTFYNAALLADLTIVSVTAHSLPVRYVLPSFDAMVSSVTDLKIQNTHPAPVQIFAKADGARLTIEIHGHLLGYSVKRMSKTIKEIQPKTEYIEDDQAGIVLFGGVNGRVSEGYLQYIYKDKVIKTVKIRHDVYAPQKRLETIAKKPAAEEPEDMEKDGEAKTP